MTDPATINIAAHLETMAARQPYTLAVVFPHGRDAQGRVSYTHFTYQQLNAACDPIAHGLTEIGIGRGVRVPCRAELHRFADAGHYVLEDAGEEIVPLIRQWLAASD